MPRPTFAVAAAVTFLISSSASLKAQQVTDALIAATSKVRVVPAASFRADVAVPDTVFECSPPEAHAADMMLPVDAMMYTANVPNRENSLMSMSVFADSTGKIIRFAERRGQPIRPDTKGLTPAQVGQAIQAAAVEFRSTTITVDYRGGRSSAANRGGGAPEVMTIGAADVIANLDGLGKPGEFAARVVAACSVRK